MQIPKFKGLVSIGKSAMVGWVGNRLLRKIMRLYNVKIFGVRNLPLTNITTRNNPAQPVIISSIALEALRHVLIDPKPQ